MQIKFQDPRKSIEDVLSDLQNAGMKVEQKKFNRSSLNSSPSKVMISLSSNILLHKRDQKLVTLIKKTVNLNLYDV